MKGNRVLQSFFSPPLSTEKCKHEWWTAEEEKAGLKSFMWLHLANRIRLYVNEGTLWPGPRVGGRCVKKFSFISNFVQKHIRWWKWGEGGNGPSSPSWALEPSCGWRPVSAGSRYKRLDHTVSHWLSLELKFERRGNTRRVWVQNCTHRDECQFSGFESGTFLLPTQADRRLTKKSFVFVCFIFHLYVSRVGTSSLIGDVLSRTSSWQRKKCW